MIPVIDLGPWREGGEQERQAIARTVDEALRRAGFLLVTGHGVEASLREEIRGAAREFFGLPVEVKRAYAAKVGGRGWLAAGAEANSYAEGVPGPPDLKESWTSAADRPTGRAAVDAEWFRPNVWPAEVPRLRTLAEEYTGRMRALSDEVLTLLAVALGEAPDFFTRHTSHPTYGFNINWYPAREAIGEVRPGQFRIGAHTDFGTITILDRQQGRGGLQVHSEEGGWEDAPFDPAAFTVNIGDLMARWTGDRWRSGRHRVLPPPADEPTEELMSLVWFFECDPGTRVQSLPGPTAYEPVDSHVYLRGKLDAISVA